MNKDEKKPTTAWTTQTLSRSASVSKSMVTCRPSSDLRSTPSTIRMKWAPAIVLGAAAGGDFGVKPCTQASRAVSAHGEQQICLTRLSSTPVRAQDAGRGLQVRADTSQIAAFYRRRGCEVDYIAAEVVNCCAGAAISLRS